MDLKPKTICIISSKISLQNLAIFSQKLLTAFSFILILFFLLIIQIILGDNLSKGDDPTYINLSYNNNYLSLESDGNVAGLQLEYSGTFDI